MAEKDAQYWKDRLAAIEQIIKATGSLCESRTITREGITGCSCHLLMKGYFMHSKDGCECS